MNSIECWVAACKRAGFTANGRSPATQIEATVEVLEGAELTAVNILLHEAAKACLESCDVERAADHLKLAAAMVEQAGRVLGALRAAQAVEEALWPDDEGLPAIHSCINARAVLIDLGFGPKEVKP